MLDLGKVPRHYYCLFAAVIFVVPPLPAYADVTVASDGSGQFRTVQQAVNAAPANSLTRFVIRIKPGVYKARIVVPHDKPFLSFVGDDAQTTVLTDDRYAAMTGPDGQPLGTFRTPSTTIEADDFIAENITFENSAGPKGQAVALAVLGDRAVFRNCRFLGWQDTLLAQTGRQYFIDSYIDGAVDFIFGGSIAYFENCHIHAKGNGYITAASTPKDQRYGYVFSRCRITGESPAVQTDLGRPWRDYASVAFLRTEMSGNIRPAGWNNWSRPDREKTARYAEYGSTGPGADRATRASWTSQLTTAAALALTPGNVLGGADGWNPKTGTVRTRLRITSASGQPPSSKTRDPGIAQGPDGHVYRVWATGDGKLTYAESTDSIHWSEPQKLDAMAHEDSVDLQSPSVFYDASKRRFIVTWASTIRQNFFQSYQEPLEDNPRIWCTLTERFEEFTPAKVLFDPGYAVRDAVLVREGSRYALVHQDSRRAIQRLRVAFGPEPLGPWGPSSDSFPARFAAKPSVSRSGTMWVIEYNAGGDKSALLVTGDFLSFVDYGVRP